LVYVIFQFNSILLLSIKTPITEQYNHMKNIYIKKETYISMYLRGPGWLNSYKPITNTAWVRAQLCKLQKMVHSIRSSK
jgi:hypothetical protein